MLELFLKLIDRLIDVTKRREEQDKNLYTNFVAPAFAEFETVHNYYLDRFKKYREVIAETNVFLNSKHPIFAMIATDDLYSDNLRQRRRELLDASRNTITEGFVNSIQVYMDAIESADQTLKPGYGGVMKAGLITLRDALMLRFEYGSSELGKRELALEGMDELVGKMQAAYAVVAHEHAALKKKLLSPK